MRCFTKDNIFLKKNTKLKIGKCFKMTFIKTGDKKNNLTK